MTPALPLAHHLVQAIPVLLPALLLPLGLVAWTIRDRRRARAEQATATTPGAGPSRQAPRVG